jgi:hypothetical protein
MDVINFIGTSINVEILELDYTDYDYILKDIDALNVSLEEYFFLEDFKPRLKALNISKKSKFSGLIIDNKSWIEFRRPGRRRKKYLLFDELNYMMFSTFPYCEESIISSAKKSEDKCIVIVLEKGKGCAKKYKFPDKVKDLGKIELRITAFNGLKICYGIDTTYDFFSAEGDSLSTSIEVKVVR